MTFGNMFCGFYGIIVCFSGDLTTGAFMIFLGAIFDLFDGMAARLVKHSSPIGAELYSLADLTTFGILPAVIVHILLLHSHQNWLFEYGFRGYPIVSFIPFLIVAGAGYRLAKFNVDTTQKNSFVGLPSPSNGIFFASLPLIMANGTFLLGDTSFYLFDLVTNAWVLIILTCLLSWLMVSPIRLFSFKIKSFKWQESKVVYIFLALDILLLIFLQWAAIPVIILLYIILSLISKPKINEVQSTN